YDTPAKLLLRNNRMLVAEGEFAFRLSNDISPGNSELSREQVMDQVDGLFPAIEIPDSRFINFASAGAARLVADNACGREFVLGDEVTGQWREIALDRFEVRMIKNGQLFLQGTGADVLGDPRDALTWLVNMCRSRGVSLQAGEIITTGVVGAPVPIAAGDNVIADFGVLGKVIVSFGD
ncbi:MAG: 2-keto-4-pentenoate hydratase, partial [Gammaproteobacteria bacterium]